MTHSARRPFALCSTSPPAVSQLPIFMTADEVAELIRTTREAVYAMAARGQLAGVTRVGRRMLFRTSELLDWLDQNRTPSPEE